MVGSSLALSRDSERPSKGKLPEDTKPEQLARLARLRWKIELDYKQLKGELGLDHYTIWRLCTGNSFTSGGFGNP